MINSSYINGVMYISFDSVDIMYDSSFFVVDEAPRDVAKKEKGEEREQ